MKLKDIFSKWKSSGWWPFRPKFVPRNGKSIIDHGLFKKTYRGSLVCCILWIQCCLLHSQLLRLQEQGLYKFYFWFEFLLHIQQSILTSLQSHCIRRQLKMFQFFVRLRKMLSWSKINYTGNFYFPFFIINLFV